MEILPFGNLDSNNVENYYSGSVHVNKNEIEIDLNFEEEQVDENILISVKETISKIYEFSNKAWSAISDDWDLDGDSETARFYLQHHLDEFSDEEIKKIFGTSKIDKQSFINSLTLTRIGLYPESEDMFIIFDIQFSPDLTNYLMSVAFDGDGEFVEISMES